jgi:hypothetical protein
MADDNLFEQPKNSIEQDVFNQQQMQQQNAPTGSKDQNAEVAQIATLINDLDRRLRILEERYSNLRKKLQLTDQGLLEGERAFGKELKSLNDDSLELKRTVNDFSDKLVMMSSELGNVAQRMDLKVIEKYLNMWSPTNFVTRTELKEFLKRKGIKTQDKQDEDD